MPPVELCPAEGMMQSGEASICSKGLPGPTPREVVCFGFGKLNVSGCSRCKPGCSWHACV